MVFRVVADVKVVGFEKWRDPSKHYVYVISVTWSDDIITLIYRRYSRFFELQSKLLDKFPVEAGVYDPGRRIIPFLPGKIFGRSHIEKVAKKRFQLIDSYCKGIAKLPKKISQCDEVLQFFEITREDIQQLLVPSENLMEAKQSHKSKDQTCDDISGPIPLEQYEAIADYDKQVQKEVNLKVGQTVEVIEKNDTGWWLVTVENCQGWVPCSYLERLDGFEEDQRIETLPDDETKYMCLDDFVPENDDEIQLDKGGTVDVVQKSLDGWWRVRFKGKEGLAPAAYLIQISLDRYKILMAQGSGSPIVESPKRSPNDSPADSRKSSLFEAMGIPRPSLDIFANLIKKSPNRSPDTPEKSIDIDQPTGGVEIVGSLRDVSNLSIKKPKSDSQSSTDSSSSTGGATFKTPKSDSQSLSESSSSPKDAIVGKSKPALFRMPSGGPVSNPGSGKAPPRRQSISENEKKRAKAPPRPEQPKFLKEYYTIADFTDSADDGIDFKAGESVEIIEQSSSGWWFVKIHDTEGWAPSSYIEERSVLIKKDAKGDSTAGYAARIPEVTVKTPPKPSLVTNTASAPAVHPISGLQRTLNAALQRVPSDLEDSDDDEFDDDEFNDDIDENEMPAAKNTFCATNANSNNDFEIPSERPYELYIACAPYEKVEDTEISFDEDDIVEVVEKTEDGWWLIKIDDEEGWAPESYLVKFEDDEDEFIEAGTDDCANTGSFGHVEVKPSSESEEKSSEKPPVVAKFGLGQISAQPKVIVPSHPKPTFEKPKPVSVKPVCVPKPVKADPILGTKPAFGSKPKLSKPPKLVPKPETQKQVVKPTQQKETITKSKVSSVSSMFETGKVAEGQTQSKLNSGQTGKVSAARQMFGQPVSGPTTSSKPYMPKSNVSSTSKPSYAAVKPKPSPLASKPKPLAKPSQLNGKPKPSVGLQGKAKFGSKQNASSGNSEGELSDILARRKVKVDSNHGNSNRRSSGSRGSQGDKNLQVLFNQLRPR